MTTKKTIITHPLYLAPIPVYAHLYASAGMLTDGDSPFVKQTFRNRAIIATENGTQALIIPVEHNGVQAIRDIRISEHGRWRHLHWNALKSAYKKSPFFDYYADDFAHFYEESDSFLMDFNMRLHHTICELIGIDRPVAESNKTTMETAIFDSIDIRPLADPKTLKESKLHTTPHYYQIFAQRNGFIENLSIIDLLFNMGPEGLITLKKAAELL